MNDELKAIRDAIEDSQDCAVRGEAAVESLAVLIYTAEKYLARLAADEAERAEREKPIDENADCELVDQVRRFLSLGFTSDGRLRVWGDFDMRTRGQLIDLLRALGIQVKP